MNKINPTLAIVVPCFNEEIIIQESVDTLKKMLNELIDSKSVSDESYICFVDDGSSDKTWEILSNISDQQIKALRFACNFDIKKLFLLECVKAVLIYI